MEERPLGTIYGGEERRKRWPGEWPGQERRKDALAFETDQEPDQSPLASVGLSISGSPAARG